VCQSGGGGYGDPYRRDPDDVRRDVRDGLVSIAAAKEKYGVIIDAASGEVNADMTRTLRATARNGNGHDADIAVEPVAEADLNAIIGNTVRLREGWM
jgi:hypothetical protein